MKDPANKMNTADLFDYILILSKLLLSRWNLLGIFVHKNWFERSLQERKSNAAKWNGK
jgi:hypothetical protein